MFACKEYCTGSDPTSDTVKVNPALLAGGKENVQPQDVARNAHEEQKAKDQEERRRAEEKILQQQKEDERRQVEEQARKRRAEEETKRQAAEREAAEAAERAVQDAAAAAAASAQQEQQRLEEERIAEEKACQEREAAESAKAADELVAREKVQTWCKANGFKEGDMNSCKKSFLRGSKFPLHEAVAKNNEEMVGLMVRLGADKGLKNSKGQTPEDLATQMNKKASGSMDAVIAHLTNSQ